MVKGRAPRHRGVLMGRVVDVVETMPLSSNGGSARDCAAETGRRRGVRCGGLAQSGEPEEGGRVYEVIRQWTRSNCGSPMERSDSIASGRAIWSGGRTIPMCSGRAAVHGSDSAGQPADGAGTCDGARGRAADYGMEVGEPEPCAVSSAAALGASAKARPIAARITARAVRPAGKHAYELGEVSSISRFSVRPVSC